MRAPMQSMHAGVTQVDCDACLHCFPQRWCTRAAPFRRSRTRTRDPLINCTEAARTHARTLLRDIRPLPFSSTASIVPFRLRAFRPSRYTLPSLLFPSFLPSFLFLLPFDSTSRRSFSCSRCAGIGRDTIRTAAFYAESVLQGVKISRPRSRHVNSESGSVSAILNGSSRSTVENSYRLSRWCTTAMLARYDPILSTEALSNVSRTLETFLIAIRNMEIQWNVVTRLELCGGMIFSFFSFVSNSPSNPFPKIVVRSVGKDLFLLLNYNPQHVFRMFLAFLSSSRI